MALSAVRAALETAKTPDTGTIAKIEEEHDRLKDILDGLLPAERPAYRQIEQRCRDLAEQRELLMVAEKLGGLPRLNTNVLSWTKRQKMPYRALGHRPVVMVPTFAYLPVLESSSELSVNGYGTFSTAVVTFQQRSTTSISTHWHHLWITLTASGPPTGFR